jgi:hypothetical protein
LFVNHISLASIESINHLVIWPSHNQSILSRGEIFFLCFLHFFDVDLASFYYSFVLVSDFALSDFIKSLYDCVIIGEDKLEISNVNLEEQQKIIDMWIERQKSKIKNTERKN